MKSLLQHLQDDEAILLMYLAQELPPADRAQVERRLAGEPKLQNQLAELKALQESCAAALDALDRRDPPAVAESAAVRRVSRLMRQWNLQRTSRRIAPAARPAIPWFGYGMIAAAAAILFLGIGYLAWSPTIHTVSPAPTGPEVVVNLSEQEKLAILADTLDNSTLADSSDVGMTAAVANPPESDFSIDSPIAK